MHHLVLKLGLIPKEGGRVCIMPKMYDSFQKNDESRYTNKQDFNYK